MKNFKLGVIIALLFALIGCKESNTLPEGNQTNDVVNNALDSINPENNNVEFGESNGDEESKIIKWGDGNSYEYYYTEVINVNDINGEIVPITVYINSKNMNPDCNNKKCKWCNSIIYSTNSYTEEYPNLSNLRENPNRDSLAELVLTLGLNIKSYIDSDDTNGVSIRTEVINHCEYDDVHGYCSNKCYHEANY